jgi:hypothetical protein
MKNELSASCFLPPASCLLPPASRLLLPVCDWPVSNALAILCPSLLRFESQIRVNDIPSAQRFSLT